MTNEEAIETLKRNYPPEWVEQLREAVDTAISALQTQDVPDTNVGDMISRSDAIDAVETKIKKWNAVDGEGYHVGIGLRYTDVISTLTELSPAQPEIIHCKVCKWWDKKDDSNYGYCMAMEHEYYPSKWEVGIYRKYKGDFYCADAERRTDEQTD